MRNVGLMIALLWAGQLFGQVALGDIVGEVYDVAKKEPLYGAYVFVESNGARYQANTDPDGRFRISAVPAGLYFVNIRVGTDTLKNIQANVPMDGYANIGIIRYERPGEVIEYSAMSAAARDPNRIRLEYGSLPVKTITSKDIVHSPAKNDIKGMITGASTDVRMTDDGELVFRGARKGDMLYLIDGVKTEGIGQMPSSAIGRMQIYSGGLPAKYGDTLGGVVVMETKSYFDLYNEWYAQELKKGNQ